MPQQQGFPTHTYASQTHKMLDIPMSTSCGVYGDDDLASGPFLKCTAYVSGQSLIALTEI